MKYQEDTSYEFVCVCVCAPKVLFIACFVPVESTSTKPGFSRFALAFWKVPCLNTKFCLEPSEPQVFWRTTQTRNRPRPLDVTRDRLQTLVEEHVAKNFWELLKRRWRFWKSWSSDRRIVGFCAHRVVYGFFWAHAVENLGITPSQRTTWSCFSSGTSTRKANHGALCESRIR